jgi:hypothetical protein
VDPSLPPEQAARQLASTAGDVTVPSPRQPAQPLGTRCTSGA